MIERIQQFIDSLPLDVSRASLGVWIAAINVSIVLLVVGGISVSAIGSLRDLADQQGQSRVQLAGALAREDLRRYGEDALTYAKSVAERQTFQRLLATQRAASIEPFLRRSCANEVIAACAVFDRGQLLAQAGVPLPWDDIADAAQEQGESFMAAPPGAASLLGAVATIAAPGEPQLYVVRLLDDALAAALTERVGLQVNMLDYQRFIQGSEVDDLTRLHSAGLSDGGSAVARLDGPGLYVASFPIFAATGEAIVLLEARLPADEIDAAVSGLIKRLLITALVLGSLALLASVVLGRQVTGPLGTLTNAVMHLGQGDFSTAIPVGGTREVGRLGRTIEDMRNNLVKLTSALRRREAEAQAVLGGVVEGVYAVDKMRVIRYLNPQAARLLQVKPEEVIGRFCGDVLKPCRDADGRRPCDYACPIVQARLDGSARATERLELGEGAPRTAVITSAAAVDELQVQVIRDETEMEGVRRARDSVLVNISHEFRTPLAAQLASIELLRDGLEQMDAAQQRELVLSLERSTLRLTRLIDNLLESVRIEAGQLSIRSQSVALSEVIEDTEQLIGALLTQRHQQLLIDLPESLPNVNGDGPRLTQVLLNLLANASKFAPEHSVVRVGAAPRGEREVALWVEDEGPGVPAQERQSIFDRFHRSAGEEPEPGGLGLGLWIVKSIIERHGGRIDAWRTGQERTRFEVVLPVAND